MRALANQRQMSPTSLPTAQPARALRQVGESKNPKNRARSFTHTHTQAQAHSHQQKDATAKGCCSRSSNATLARPCPSVRVGGREFYAKGSAASRSTFCGADITSTSCALLTTLPALASLLLLVLLVLSLLLVVLLVLLEQPFYRPGNSFVCGFMRTHTHTHTHICLAPYFANLCTIVQRKIVSRKMRRECSLSLSPSLSAP